MHFFRSDSLSKCKTPEYLILFDDCKEKKTQFTTTIFILFDELGVLKKITMISEVI